MDNEKDLEKIRQSIIGFGENSSRKSYFPELQSKINQLEQAKKQLELSEKNLIKMFNTISDAIFIHRFDGSIVFANEAMLSMYGVSSENFKDYKIEDYSGSQNITKLYNIFKELSDGNKLVFEWLAKKPITNKKFFVDVSLSPYSWYGEDCILAVVRDITEKKIAEEEKNKLREQLFQSQKMDAIGQLAGGIAHDFNNMLNAIIGSAELIKTGVAPQKQQDFIEIILKAANNAGELTRKLLTFSRRTDKAQKSYNLVNIIEESISLLKRSINKNISIIFNKHAETTQIKGDLSLLESVFINLGVNASHAMPDGGTLIFSIENINFDKAFCEGSSFSLEPGEFIKISVRDTGTGIPPENITKIFDPFFTTKDVGKGTGLGLSIVYGTIVDHKGAISVYSEMGEGTVFHIYLPVDSTIIYQKQVEPEEFAGEGTVLLIEDEEIIRRVEIFQLKTLGFETIIAENGKIGVEKFIENRDKIKLIILDMIMPVMSGKETFYHIRNIDKDVPIIISSGFSKEENMKEMSANGVSGFLPKPFRINDLILMLTELNLQK